MPKIRRYRTLFLNDLEPSKKVLYLLETVGMRFSRALVSPDSKEWREDDLPALVTDQGEWRGPEAIQRYVKNALTWNEV